MMEEVVRLVRDEVHAGVMEKAGQKYRLRKGVEVWLYVSALPVRPG
jgi:hypothetical protein